MSAPKALSLKIRDDETLQSAYLPWLTHGGLFVPTRDTYGIGQRAYLLITLPGESERSAVEGDVVWITPQGTNRRVAGIGVHFDEAGRELRHRIEARLASSAPDNVTLSHTL
ncbi:PilZ domain-containing protein [Salinicola aestuarinus]|uniref:PilZ domain-containing protein n=1 Tax=Salinicola aestuarinus TaxID=1949082 RepID=UPI000DA185B6|nr:PilZ domain-containing protein [Salinicola aestuarinus]